MMGNRAIALIYVYRGVIIAIWEHGMGVRGNTGMKLPMLKLII